MNKKILISVCICLFILLFSNSLWAGEVSFEVIPSTQVLNVGDTLVLTTKIVFSDLSEKIDVEPLSKLELIGFTTVSTSPRHRKGVEDGIEFEERITTFKMIAVEEGRHVIPSFQIPYKNSSSGEEVYLTSQELEVTVKPSSKLANSPNTIYIILIFVVTIFFSVIGFLFWLKRIKSKQFAEEEGQNIKTKFSNWIDELSGFLANGKKDTFTEQSFHFVNEYIEDNYKLGLKGKKHDKRIKLVNEKKISPEIVDLFNRTYSLREELRFGGIVKESDQLKKILEDLKKLVKS